jgi:hypothetical protein
VKRHDPASAEALRNLLPDVGAKLDTVVMLHDIESNGWIPTLHESNDWRDIKIEIRARNGYMIRLRPVDVDDQGYGHWIHEVVPMGMRDKLEGFEALFPDSLVVARVEFIDMNGESPKVIFTTNQRGKSLASLIFQARIKCENKTGIEIFAETKDAA